MPFFLTIKGAPANALDALTRGMPEKIEKIVQGRHVMEWLGLGQDPEVGRVVKDMFNRQIEGEFSTLEEAKELLLSL